MWLFSWRAYYFPQSTQSIVHLIMYYYAEKVSFHLFLWKVLEQLNRLISIVSDVVGKSWLFGIVGISSIAGVGEMDRVDMMLWGICTLQAKHEDLSSDPEVLV